MMKKLIFGCCLAFGLFYGDCWGMQRLNSNVLSQSSSNQTGSSALVEKGQTQVVKSDTIGDNMTAQNPENDSSCSRSSSEEWIEQNRVLIDQAKSNEGAFRELIHKLQDENMVFVYDEICDNCWFNQHLYDTCHDGVRFYGGVGQHQTCGF